MQTATNPKTGETVALVDGAWQPVKNTAKNDKGEVAYLVGDKWHTGAAQQTKKPLQQIDLNGPQDISAMESIAANPLVRTAVSAASLPLSAMEWIPGVGDTVKESRKRYGEMVERGKTLQSKGEQVAGEVGNIGGLFLDPLGYATGTSSLKAVQAIKGLKKAPVLTNVLAGGLAGTTAAGIEGKNLGDTMAAGGLGAAVPLALGAAGRTGRLLYNTVDQAILPQGATMAAGRVAGDAAADKYDDVVNALAKSGRMETGRQAIVPTGNRKLSGLLEMAEQNDPTPSNIRLDEQAARRMAALERVTPDMDAAIAARKSATAPLRETALEAANVGGTKGQELTEKIAEKRRSMVSAMQNAGQMQTEAAQAGVRAQNFVPVEGQPRIAARYSPNIDRVPEFAGGSADAAQIAAQRRAEMKFADFQRQAMEASGLKPLRGESVFAAIDQTLGAPGIRASDVAQKSLGYLRDKLASLTNQNGVIDAKDLYTVRKEIGNQMEQFAKESNNWDKRFTAGLQKDIQKAMDDAIENAGGSGWKQYLSKYSELSKPIEQAQILGDVKAQLKGVAGSERLASVQGAIERGKLGQELPDLTKGQRGVVEAIVKQAEKSKMSDTMAAQGQTKAREMFNAEEIPISFPNLLSRPVAVANAILRRAEGAGKQATLDELSRLNLNPRELAEVIKTADAKQKRWLIENIMAKTIPFTVAPVAAMQGEQR
jgi:hypothetical protein